MDLGNNDSEMEPGALCSFLLTSPFQDANLSGCSDTRPDSRTCVRPYGRAARRRGHVSRFADIQNEE